MQRLIDMSTSELIQFAAQHSASIKEVGIYSELMKELTTRLGANTAAVTQALKERDEAREQVVNLAVENANARSAITVFSDATEQLTEIIGDEIGMDGVAKILAGFDAVGNMPATDAAVANIKAQGRIEGAHFVANRMLAAWDAGFIDDTAKNAADIARMILTSTEFMPTAPEGDFDRSFADGVLKDISAQLREVLGK